MIWASCSSVCPCQEMWTPGVGRLASSTWVTISTTSARLACGDMSVLLGVLGDGGDHAGADGGEVVADLGEGSLAAARVHLEREAPEESLRLRAGLVDGRGELSYVFGARTELGHGRAPVFGC